MIIAPCSADSLCPDSLTQAQEVVAHLQIYIYMPGSQIEIPILLDSVAALKPKILSAGAISQLVVVP